MRLEGQGDKREVIEELEISLREGQMKLQGLREGWETWMKQLSETDKRTLIIHYVSGTVLTHYTQLLP